MLLNGKLVDTTAAFDRIKREAKERWENHGQRTFLFVVAAGHGQMEDGQVVLIYNEVSEVGEPVSF